MHYLAEVIIPPVDDIEKAVEQVMADYNENQEDQSGFTFWDWWQIGGRFAGSKLASTLDKDKLEAFWAKLTEMKVTVSGLQWGKQELSPSGQIETVDGLWRDFFPETGIRACPMFLHSNRNKDPLEMDICTLDAIPNNHTCCSVLIAKEHWQDNTKLECSWQIHEDVWLGSNYVKTDWDKNVLTAIEKYLDYIKRYKDEWVATNKPKKDWLCVSVDYHS